MIFGVGRRTVSTPEAACAAAVRALAALFRAGMDPRGALIDWHRDAPAELAPALNQLSRRLRVGASIDNALSRLSAKMGPDGASLAGVFAVHTRVGGDPAHMLDALAAQIERRSASLQAARAASSGILLSGRIVAGLPLLFLLLAPAGRVPLLDAVGLTTLAAGALLAAGGILWIERLVPSPDALDDPAAVVGEITASVLDGGSGLNGALEVLSEHCPEPLRPAFRRAGRFVRLGVSWPDALVRCGDERLRELAAALRLGQRLGIPLARSLESWAGSRRARLVREFEAATRRAPVLMVVPLTLCVLPSYIALVLGPILRGL